MAIDFPIDIPLQEYSSATVTEVNITSFVQSPYTGRAKVQEFAGDYWRLQLNYRNLNRELAQDVLAFISSLRSQVGTFKMVYPGYSVPLGAASTIPSSPLVDGAAQEGFRQINIKSAPPNTEAWLKAGDIIQLGPANQAHFHRVLTDIETDSFGRATIDIWPAVREGVLDNDAIEYNSPLGLFRLLSAPKQTLTAPDLHAITLECREVN